MIKKFAVLAVIAGVFAACGGGKDPAQIEAEAKATADSIAKALEQTIQDAAAKEKAMQDSIAAAAQAMGDSATNAVEGAVDAAKEAVK